MGELADTSWTYDPKRVLTVCPGKIKKLKTSQHIHIISAKFPNKVCWEYFTASMNFPDNKQKRSKTEKIVYYEVKTNLKFQLKIKLE